MSALHCLAEICSGRPLWRAAGAKCRPADRRARPSGDEMHQRNFRHVARDPGGCGAGLRASRWTEACSRPVSRSAPWPNVRRSGPPAPTPARPCADNAARRPPRIVENPGWDWPDRSPCFRQVACGVHTDHGSLQPGPVAENPCRLMQLKSRSVHPQPPKKDKFRTWHLEEPHSAST